MYGRNNQVRDACMTMDIVLDLLSSKGSHSEKIATLPTSQTKKSKIECSKDDFKKIIRTMKGEPYKKDLTDGIKIFFGGSSWVMVRLSSTEPIARIYAESDSQANLDDIFCKYMLKIKLAVGR